MLHAVYKYKYYTNVWYEHNSPQTYISQFLINKLNTKYFILTQPKYVLHNFIYCIVFVYFIIKIGKTIIEITDQKLLHCTEVRTTLLQFVGHVIQPSLLTLSLVRRRKVSRKRRCPQNRPSTLTFRRWYPTWFVYQRKRHTMTMGNDLPYATNSSPIG